MGLFPACNLPWIDTTINKYVDNIPQFRSQVDTIMCCLTPGDCTTNPVQGQCPLGFLECHFGNSRYACNFTPIPGQGPRCWAEGSLTHTRNIPCCQSHLYEFMKTQSCMGGYSTANNTSICCTGKDAGSLGQRCVSEFGLENEVSPNCLSMTFPSSGCALGAAPGAITSVSTALPSTTGAPTSTATGIELPKSAGGKIVVKKWLALCMVAPALLQLVFL
ncbi:hypothetical protein BGZ81_008741 [Podila clonocystis]|nr:hypothetical protein BGZ81_008741 [Podila clonocystis]